MLVILLLLILLFLKWWQGHIQELWTQGVASFAPAAGSCMCHWAVELHCGVKTDGTCQIMSKTDEFEDSFKFVGASLLAHGKATPTELSLSLPGSYFSYLTTSVSEDDKQFV